MEWYNDIMIVIGIIFIITIYFIKVSSLGWNQMNHISGRNWWLGVFSAAAGHVNVTRVVPIDINARGLAAWQWTVHGDFTKKNGGWSIKNAGFNGGWTGVVEKSCTFKMDWTGDIVVI